MKHPNPFLATILVLSVWAIPSARADLTFDDRVAAQRAVEEVYWRHRIWPAVNPGEKPPLGDVLSEAVLRARVEDPLRMSAALEEFWSRPITPAGLQAEIDRMARSTRRPGMLRELFAALGDDPRLVAECLARPVLVDRLVHEAYARDERIHGVLLRRVRAEVATLDDPGDLRHASGRYVETVWRLSRDRPEESASRHATIVVDSEDAWRDARARIHRALGSIADPGAPLPAGRIGPIQESGDALGVVAVLRQDADSFVTASVTWPRATFDEWWSERRTDFPAATPTTGASAEYALPEIAGTPCVDDTWSPTLAGAADPRYDHTAIWTGTEMVIWGGRDLTGEKSTGGRYDPATDTWAPLTTFGAPSKRREHTAIWTGSEMIVWGGISGTYLGDGGHYSPSTNTWSPTGGGVLAPTARAGHSAVWSGRMIVWGGVGSTGHVNSGATYDPNAPFSFRWSPTNTVNAPSAREGHTAIWAGTVVTGTDMVVWGGFTGATLHGTGGRYNPSTNTWSAVTMTGAPSARREHTAVWTGTEMIVWGGSDGAMLLNSGGRYDPSANAWTATSAGANVPSARRGHSAVWAPGTGMIVWGGVSDFGAVVLTGGRYAPSTNTWTATSTGANVPFIREHNTAVWTGTEMIIWGGIFTNTLRDVGGRYDPVSDVWAPTAVGNAPKPRTLHTLVWTGAEMIVYGGYDGVSYVLPGQRYDPATDTWSASIGGPASRSQHVAVWTGTEMIVYGGWDGTLLATGQRYDPTTTAWAPIATHAPGRLNHTAVWTGREMLVWGGRDASFNLFQIGGRYDPAANSWTTTSTGANVPSAREGHTAVWTGRSMIVFGGSAPGRTNTGAIYDTVTDSWTPTSTGAGVPSARYDHTGVWTGREMIVWGGNVAGPFTSTGGRYDPSTDTWAATSTGAGVPAGRSRHSAVWTRDEMIVWGGSTDTGGRYDPATDTWTATSLINAPSSRVDHEAVWTGEDMIVWGGTPHDSVGGRYCACTASPPAATPALAASVPVAGTVRLSWPALAGATSYDVVAGKVSTLRSSGGDFSQATERCLLGNGSATMVDDATVPPTGDAFWYLARGATCGGPGTYGSGRDAGIAASGLACP